MFATLDTGLLFEDIQKTKPKIEGTSIEEFAKTWAAAWAGGLPVFFFAIIEQRRFAAYDARENTLDICSRFSLMAIVAVTLEPVNALRRG